MHIPSTHNPEVRRGMTLVEMLVAMTLTLVLMGAVAQIFGMFGRGLNGSRAVTELYERMRATGFRLREDLNGVTVDTSAIPPVLAARNNGYFEYIEGPETDRITYFSGSAFNKANGAVVDGKWVGSPEPYLAQVGSDDRLVGDIDDVLLFTTRASGELFSGHVDTRNGNLAGGSVRSPYAEVVWFCRPTPNTSNPRTYTLYRRQRLVMAHPGAEPFVNTVAGGQATNSFGGPPNTLPFTKWTDLYARTDVSCRRQGTLAIPNSLGDLTRRENRFLHGSTFPFEFPHPLYAYDAENHTFDNNPARFGEDIILTNVLAFDVRLWDPDALVQAVPAGASRVAVEPGDNGYIPPGSPNYPAVGAPGFGSQGAYVDLGWNGSPGAVAVGAPFPTAGATPFQGRGSLVSNAPGNRSFTHATYDTWTDFYELNGVDEDGDAAIDEGTNGLDDNGNGLIDEPAEQETSPPYPVALQHSSGSASGTGGIQVRIRCYEPSSRQIRQITILQQL